MKDPIDMNEAEMRARFDFSKATRGRLADLFKNGHRTVLLDHDPDSADSIFPNAGKDSTRKAGKRIFVSRAEAAGLRVDDGRRCEGADLRLSFAAGTTRDGATFAVKLKAYSDARFTLYKTDLKAPRSLLAYVWNAKTPEESSIYALTYEEALRIVQARPYVETKSWVDYGGYSIRVGVTLKKMLEPYRMTPERWKQRLQSI
jgi:hypothetical protein